MSKKTAIAIAMILLVVVPAFVILLYKSNDNLKDPYHDDWYKDEIKQTTIDYIRQNEKITEKIQICGYSYTGFDYDVVMSNRTKEQKIYPFKTITVTAQTRNSNFSLCFSVNADGELQVENMEKEKTINLFL